MKAPSFLDDAQIERLSDLLDQRAVPFKGFNLEALDGYLSALVVSPGDIPPEEWQPAVWGTPPRWADAAEREQVEALLQGHWNMASQRVRFGEAEAEHPDELDVGRDWAFGFFRAVELRETDWEKWLDEEDWIDEIFVRLDQLASGEVLGEDPEAPGTPVSYRERLEIIAGLPGMLADLHHHRIDALTPREPIRKSATPDRNDPCPCGSGRKYKKCCGA